MQKRTTILAVILIVVVIVIALVIRANRHNLIDSSIDTPDGVIKVYLEAMIPHHQEAVDSSLRVVDDKTIEDANIKIIAGRIFDQQTFEIVQMRSWYSDWFGAPYNASSTLWKGSYMPMMSVSMTATGDQLKKAYIDEMIAHHKMAIDMSKEAKKALLKLEKNNAASTGDITISDANPIFEQAETFMQRIIDTQNKEIDQLSSLQD